MKSLSVQIVRASKLAPRSANRPLCDRTLDLYAGPPSRQGQQEAKEPVREGHGHRGQVPKLVGHQQGRGSSPRLMFTGGAGA